MTRSAHLAIDLGAESGRALLVVLDPGGSPALAFREVHRFPNLPLHLPSGLCWDLPGLYREVVAALGHGVALARSLGVPLRSVGVDTWGVDFGLVTPGGELLLAPCCYRDPRASAAFERVVARVGRERLHARTGVQFLPFNTLFQLAGLLEREPSLAALDARLAFMPDLLHFLLTGRQVTEATIASTSQMTDPRAQDWDRGLLTELGLPVGWLGAIEPAGAVLGPLRAEVAAATGAPRDLAVVVPAAHDTASAVLAVPAVPGTAWAYLSSGTWSLLGVERSTPVLTPAAGAASVTNEWGFGGSIRLLKNLAGLWLVQECRRAFAAAGTALDYAELTALASAAGPTPTRLDLADPELLAPGDMPARVVAHAERTGQPVPRSPGAIVRVCLESLADATAQALRTIEELTDQRLDVLHVVGGGVRNRLLNELIEAAIERPLARGPAEATALGNALSQVLGLGLLPDVAAARALVRDLGESPRGGELPAPNP
ncbi:MAG: rhamnulokinase [Planctomycetes bacterium]|nr:rhamnulokinase [Planctomycetota bacterium]